MADGLSSANLIKPLSPQNLKFSRSAPIVPETERILDRRNSCLKSRAQISDGSARRFFVVRGKNLGC
jgi:hypothetical protein